MFEITVSSAKTKNKDISFIITKLRPRLKAMKAIMVCEEFDGRVNLAFAVNENNKDIFLSLLFEAISETIIRNYKEEVLLENLRYKINDKVTLLTFVKALTMYDKASDKELIKSKLKPDKIINIDSLYLFRLWELEKRWVSVASLLSENSSYLMMSGSFNDLMKFLIMTNDVEFGDIYLTIENNKIFAKSAEGTEVFNIEYNNDDNCKIKIASELISLSPKKIILGKEFSNLDVAKYLEFLYEGKISTLK